jgi:hypothetical protein
MMFNCVELVTQQLRKFRATFAAAVVASSCAKGRCLTVNLPFYANAIAVCIVVTSLAAPLLRQPRCMARSAASIIKSGFIRSSVHLFTSATLRRFHRRRLLHATDFFQAAIFTVRGGVSVMATFSLLAAHVRSSWLQLHRLISAGRTADVERC